MTAGYARRDIELRQATRWIEQIRTEHGLEKPPVPVDVDQDPLVPGGCEK